MSTAPLIKYRFTQEKLTVTVDKIPHSPQWRALLSFSFCNLWRILDEALRQEQLSPSELGEENKRLLPPALCFLPQSSTASNSKERYVAARPLLCLLLSPTGEQSPRNGPTHRPKTHSQPLPQPLSWLQQCHSEVSHPALPPPQK